MPVAAGNSADWAAKSRPIAVSLLMPDYETDSDPLLASLDAMAEEESAADLDDAPAAEPDYFEASARDMFDALKEDDFDTFLDALSELIER
jgi:hypothetical protein